MHFMLIGCVLFFSNFNFFPVIQVRGQVSAEQGPGGGHGVGQYEQRGGAQPARVRAVRAEAQHPAAAEGLYCPAVHLQARQTHGLPPRAFRAAGEGGWVVGSG